MSVPIWRCRIICPLEQPLGPLELPLEQDFRGQGTRRRLALPLPPCCRYSVMPTVDGGPIVASRLSVACAYKDRRRRRPLLRPYPRPPSKISSSRAVSLARKNVSRDRRTLFTTWQFLSRFLPSCPALPFSYLPMPFHYVIHNFTPGSASLPSCPSLPSLTFSSTYHALFPPFHLFAVLLNYLF